MFCNAVQLCSLPARIKSRLCPRISFNAFPQLRHAKPLPNIAILHCCIAHHHVSLPLPFNTRHFHGIAKPCVSIAFHSMHSSACLCSSPRRFALQSCSLPCRYLACLFNAFAKHFTSMPIPNFALQLPRNSYQRRYDSRHILSLPSRGLSVLFTAFAFHRLYIAPHFHALAQPRNAIL